MRDDRRTSRYGQLCAARTSLVLRSFVVDLDQRAAARLATVEGELDAMDFEAMGCLHGRWRNNCLACGGHAAVMQQSLSRVQSLFDAAIARVKKAEGPDA